MTAWKLVEASPDKRAGYEGQSERGCSAMAAIAFDHCPGSSFAEITTTGSLRS
jgi:hypothetical protein